MAAQEPEAAAYAQKITFGELRESGVRDVLLIYLHETRTPVLPVRKMKGRGIPREQSDRYCAKILRAKHCSLRSFRRASTDVPAGRE